jgi:hypothetical protein
MRSLLILLMISFPLLSQAQKSLKAGVVGFYNLENLFDTTDNEGVSDEEFTPGGLNRWTGDRYILKIGRLAEVISRLGEDEGIKGGPAILGVCEIENRSVLEDLVKHPFLKGSNYQVVHYDSPDLRGVDVGLIYQPRYFRVLSTDSPVLVIFDDNGNRVYTRDQLVVTGIFDGDTLSVIVNHWPSRSSGELRSRPRRNAAASLTRRLTDSLFTINSGARIIIMGDLNDDPVNESVRKYLGASGNREKIGERELYNCMYPLFSKGIGSLYYQDGMNLFDQVIISAGLLKNNPDTYGYYLARVYNKSFLVQQDGQYKGYPLRTYAGGAFMGGYSDHFPVYIVLVKRSN